MGYSKTELSLKLNDAVEFDLNFASPKSNLCKISTIDMPLGIINASEEKVPGTVSLIDEGAGDTSLRLKHATGKVCQSQIY